MDFRSVRRTHYVVLAALLSFGIMCSISARAADTTIDFESYPPGTTVIGQYTSSGVTFNNTSSAYPVITAVSSSVAQSGTQVASIYDSGHAPTTANCRGDFTALRSHVRVYAGYLPSATAGSTVSLTMTALDATNVPITSVSQTITAGGGVHTALDIQIPIANIAAFTITGTAGTNQVAIDDLTFDNPVQPDFTIKATQDPVRVAPGTSASTTITIAGMNNFKGTLNFNATGLPIGVAPGFAPNPAWAITTVTFTAAPGTPVSNTPQPVTITATPTTIAAGQSAHSIPLGVLVKHRYTVTPDVAEVYLPSCGTVKVPFTIATDLQGFFDTVTLMTKGSPSDVTAVMSQPTVNPVYKEPAHMFVSLTADPKTPPTTDFWLYLYGFDGGELVATRVIVHPVPFCVKEVNPHQGTTPQALQPGSVVQVYLDGPTTNVKLQFGNSYAVATPYLVTPLGGTLYYVYFHVPRLATTGPLALIAPDGSPIPALDTFAVSSFRNVNAYSFPNPTQTNIAFDDISDLFGYNPTHVTVDPCAIMTLGFAHCPIVTSIPDPFALVFLVVAQNALNDGQCFGMSLSDQRFMHGDQLLASYPLQPSALTSTIWNLDGPAQPSPTLYHYIHVEHVAQLSAEAIHTFLVSTLADNVGGPSFVHSEIESALNSGDHPLVSIHNSLSDGHVLVAYDVEDNPADPGGFYIDVYDCNVPFVVGENSDANGHRAREGNMDPDGTGHGSQIQVTSDGHWRFPNLGWGGTLVSLAILPYGSIPVQPTLPDTLSGLATIVFGDSSHNLATAKVVQVADTLGHKLLNPNGTLNTDPTTTLPNSTLYPPIHGVTPSAQAVILGGTGPYTETIWQRSAGTYTSSIIGGRFLARLLAIPSVAGTEDALALVPGMSMGFVTRSASKPITAQAIAGMADGSVRVVVLGTTSFLGGGDTLGFDATRNLPAIQHLGPATTIRFALSSTNPAGIPGTFQSPPISIPANATISLKPSDWTNLQQSNVTMTVSTPGNVPRKTVVPNVDHANSSIGVGVSTMPVVGAPLTQLTITTTVQSIPATATVVLQWVVTSPAGGTSTFSQTLHGSDLPAGASDHSWTYSGQGGGGATFTGSVLVLTQDSLDLTHSYLQSQATPF